MVPLSYAQNRLWFLDQLQGPSAAYNLAAGLRLAGRLDADALGAALADVVGRQESLRTLFVSPDGIPQQVVIPVERAGIGWDVVDATAWSAAQLDEAAVDAARYTFDLGAEIPLRVTLFRLAEDEHVLVAVLHHIVADGGSITPLLGDLGVAYASRCVGLAPDWTPLAVKYVDYTLWQRAQLGDLADSGSPIAAQLHYWEQALAGMPERLQLPTDRPYPPVADHRGASVAVDWPVELQQQIRRAAREHNATSFMMVQAALAVLLSKLSASSDVALGLRGRRARRPRARCAGRVFRQHLGAACRGGRGSHRCRAVGPGAPAQVRRFRAPRRALRGPGRAAQPDPKSWPIIPCSRWRWPGSAAQPAASWLWVICKSPRCPWRPAPPEWI